MCLKRPKPQIPERMCKKHMNRKQRFLQLVAAGMAAVTLAGCGGASLERPYQAPAWALAVASPALTDMESVTSTAKVDVYYDNTQSMYGFAAGGTMVRAVAALRDVVNQYANTTTYTLNGTAGGTLQWMPFEGDIHTAMADYAGFYTVGKGSFAAGTGPLQMLYYDEATLDPTAINVVITDLAEQNVDTSELASKINENILSQEGYSAALIGIQGDFNGTKYVSDLDAINEMNGVEFNGKVPIYILLTGRDAALDTYVNNLVTAFNNYELVENTDYFVARYHAGNSARVLQHGDILTVGPAVEQEGMRKDDWDTAVINQNLGLAEIDAAHLDTLIQTSDYLDMFAYEYDREVNGINAGRITLNYFLPIQRTDGLTLPVDVKVYDEAEDVTTSQLQALYDTKERIRYSELVQAPEEYETAADWTAADPSVTDAWEVTNEEGEVTAVWGWQDMRQITRDKDLSISYEIIPAGTPVYDMQMQPDGREVGDYYEGADMGLAAETELLHITLEFTRDPEERRGETVMLNIPVYGMAQSVENLPDWITAWDSAGTQDYITHTFGLENFFRTLFGLNVVGDAEYDRALREVKIADVLTCVTGLPAV